MRFVTKAHDREALLQNRLAAEWRILGDRGNQNPSDLRFYDFFCINQGLSYWTYTTQIRSYHRPPSLHRLDQPVQARNWSGSSRVNTRDLRGSIRIYDGVASRFL
jgi:hypothetical protein